MYLFDTPKKSRKERLLGVLADVVAPALVVLTIVAVIASMFYAIFEGLSRPGPNQEIFQSSIADHEKSKGTS